MSLAYSVRPFLQYRVGTPAEGNEACVGRGGGMCRFQHPTPPHGMIGELQDRHNLGSLGEG